MAKDLYDVLGIQKGANEQEIKRAYRRLAREYHPDVNKAKGADEKFKEVQSAYDVLSDPQKRSRYDQFGVTDDQAGGFGGGGLEDLKVFLVVLGLKMPLVIFLNHFLEGLAVVADHQRLKVAKTFGMI